MKQQNKNDQDDDDNDDNSKKRRRKREERKERMTNEEKDKVRDKVTSHSLRNHHAHRRPLKRRPDLEGCLCGRAWEWAPEGEGDGGGGRPGR